MHKLTSSFGLLLLLTGLFLTSCEEACDEPDIDRINGLKLQIPIEGEDAFSTQELSDLLFVRYVPFSDPLIGDTLFVNGNLLEEGPGRFIINDNFPFRNAGAPYFTTYDYFIEGFTAAFFVQIERITLQGEYDGECEYFNTQQSFFLNGDSLDLGGTDDFLVLPR
jgi:hypothetical protein